jgi:hypothetical protein
VPLVIVTVVLAEPLPVQPPVVVIATESPEEAVAATGKLEPYAAEAGAGVVTVMV